jgi:cytochrome c-type biogenesis protein CcmH
MSLARQRLGQAALAALAALTLCTAGAADDPADRLPDAAQEARARHLFQQLRCVQCQNESIDDSQAPIAEDLRRIVRRQIAAGRGDSEVMAFLVQRYGQFILLQPPFSPDNLILWLTPFALVLIGGGYLWIKSRQPAVEVPGLTEDEQRALEAMDATGLDMLPPHSGLTNAHGAAGAKH